MTRRLALLAAAIFLSCAPAWAQQHPAKPVKMIIAFPPDGGNDFRKIFHGDDRGSNPRGELR